MGLLCELRSFLDANALILSCEKKSDFVLLLSQKTEKDYMIRQREAFLACRIVDDQMLGYR